MGKPDPRWSAPCRDGRDKSAVNLLWKWDGFERSNHSFIEAAQGLGARERSFYLLLTFLFYSSWTLWLRETPGWHHPKKRKVAKRWQTLTTQRQLQLQQEETSPTLRGQILSSWSSSQCPPQSHLSSSSLCSSSLSSSLWFSSSSFLLLHPGPGERSCWRVSLDRSCALTGRHLGRANIQSEDSVDGIHDHNHSYTCCIYCLTLYARMLYCAAETSAAR